jgi:hypothetical protein
MNSTGAMAQMIEYMPSKHKTLNSNSSTAETKQKTKTVYIKNKKDHEHWTYLVPAA